MLTKLCSTVSDASLCSARACKEQVASLMAAFQPATDCQSTCQCCSLCHLVNFLWETTMLHQATRPSKSA